MNRQIKNKCNVEFPLFSPFESYSALAMYAEQRNAFRRYFFNHRHTMLKQYCSKVVDYVYFDLYSLSTRLNMDCLHCHQHCCYCTVRVPTLKEYEQLYKEKYPDIVKSVPLSYCEEFKSFVNEHGMFDKHPYVRGYINSQAKDNHCIFSFQDDEGLNKCIIHKYCLDNNISPNLFKIGSCSLFPVDIVKFDMQEEKGYVVFCSCNSTALFSRFSSIDKNTNTSYPCLDLSIAKKRNFSEETIMPAYVYADSYVKEVFDLDCVRLIEDSGLLNNVSKLHGLFNPNKG